MSWTLVAIVLVAFVLALAPTRRLHLAGWRAAPLAIYLALLIALAVAAVAARGGVRVVVPILLVLYVLPFIGAPEIVARTVARLGGGGRPPADGPVIEGTATRVVDPGLPPHDGAAIPGGGHADEDEPDDGSAGDPRADRS